MFFEHSIERLVCILKKRKSRKRSVCYRYSVTFPSFNVFLFKKQKTEQEHAQRILMNWLIFDPLTKPPLFVSKLEPLFPHLMPYRSFQGKSFILMLDQLFIKLISQSFLVYYCTAQEVNTDLCIAIISVLTLNSSSLQ